MTTAAAITLTTNGTMSGGGGGQSQTLRQVLSYLITALLAVVMVGMGCAVNLKDIKRFLKKPTAIVVGFVGQFGLMPAIAAMLAAIFKMPEVETLSLLITGSCPGGSISNIATFWVEGDISLSVTMTSISSTLGLGMMPLLLFIYQEAYDLTLGVPFDRIGITLAALVVPIAIGIFIKWKFPDLAKKLVKILSIVGFIAILAVGAVTIASYSDNFSIIPAQIACAALFPGLGMTLGYVLSSLVSLYRPLRLRHKERRTVCFETGIQNAQLAMAVINLSYENFTPQQIGRMILFPIIYVLSQILWVVLFVVAYQIYKRRFAVQVEPESEDESQDDEQHSKADEEMNGHVNTTYNDDLPPKYDNAVDHDVKPDEYDHNTQL